MNILGLQINEKPDLEISLLAGRQLPVFINQKSEACYKLESASIPHRVFVITIPKSGTYLIAKILQSIGLVDCQVHIATENIQDNRFAPTEKIKLQPWKFLVHIPLKTSTRFIRSGQFAFGHIPCLVAEQQVLYDFKKLLTFREMRDVITSLVRYHDSREHEYAKERKVKIYAKFKQAPMGTNKFKAWFEMWGEEYTRLIRDIILWMDVPEVFKLKFETLMGDDGREAQLSLLKEVASFIELDVTEEQLSTALNDSIGSDTITYSGRRSLHEEWWNDELEELFCTYEFDDINRRLGYS